MGWRVESIRFPHRQTSSCSGILVHGIQGGQISTSNHKLNPIPAGRRVFKIEECQRVCSIVGRRNPERTIYIAAMSVSEDEMRALKALAADDNLPLRFLAEQVWPGHPMHTKQSGGGHRGWVMGRGAILRIGILLRGMEKKGLVRRTITENRVRYHISHTAKQMMDGN